MGWKDLDIKLKAELIKLGVRSGIKDIKLIRQLYDNNNNSISDYSSNSYTGNETELVNNVTNELQINQEELFINGLIQEYNLIELQDNYIMNPNIDTPPLNLSTTGEYLQLFKNGGPIEDKRIKKYNNNSAGYLYDSFVTDNLEEGENPHNSREYTISEEEAEKLGYYRDEISGHRDDAVKLPDHPSHSSRGTFKDIDGYHIFDLTDKGANDVNYTISGLIDNGDDHVIPIYKGSYMLPEVTVTPNGNYVHDTYNNLKWHLNKFKEGGYENPDEPPVSESTYVEQPPLNILELELLNYLLSNPTAEQEYFRNLAILSMNTPQSNLGVIQTKENQNLVDKAFLGYNNFRYSHPWAEGLNYMPIIGDGMDLISLAGAVNNKNYINAGLGLGMIALPNFILKPLQKSKYINKNTKKFLEIPDEHIRTFIPSNVKTLGSTSLMLLERPSKLTELELQGLSKHDRTNISKDYGYRKTIPNKNLYEGTALDNLNFPYSNTDIQEAAEDIKNNMLYSNKTFQKNKNNRYEHEDRLLFGVPENVEIFNKDLLEYTKSLPDADPMFLNSNGFLSAYVLDYRRYLNNIGYDANDLSDNDIAKILTLLYKDLTNSMSGKTKGMVVWHSSPTVFELFDFSNTGKYTGNMGYGGPGNYFSAARNIYGGKNAINILPYLINNVLSTPLISVMQEKGLLPYYMSPDNSRLYLDKIKELIKQAQDIKTDNKLYIDDISHAPSGTLKYPTGRNSEYMLRRNYGIKSLFPHPSLLIRDNNGKLKIIRNWEDQRVNFKNGGFLFPNLAFSHKFEK